MQLDRLSCVPRGMDLLDAIFGGGSGKVGDADSGVGDVNSADAEAELDEREDDEVEELEADVSDGLDWKVLALFIGGGSVLLALVVALMWWVLGGVVEGS